MAERDEAQGLSHEARDLIQSGAAFLPAAVADHAVLLDDAAEGAQQQRHGVVGDLLDEGVGAVGDGDAAGGRGGDVHEVHADAAEGDELDVGQGLDDARGDAGAAAVDGGGVLGGGDEAVFVGGDLGDGAVSLERLHLEAELGRWCG